MQTHTLNNKGNTTLEASTKVNSYTNPLQLLLAESNFNSSRGNPLQAVGNEEAPSESVISDKADFLNNLYQRLHQTGTEVYSGSNLTVEGCPVISNWFDRYRGESFGIIVKAARRYASAGTDISEDELIEKVCERAKAGFERQAQTGEITEIPEELPGEEIKQKLPTPQMVLQGKFTGNPLAKGIMQFGNCLPGRRPAVPPRVDVPMNGCHTVNDAVTTLWTGGFAGCVGLVMFNGGTRTLAHISSGLVGNNPLQAQYPHFMGQVAAAAATATNIHIYNALGTWAQGDGGGGDALIADFALAGGGAAINFVPGHVNTINVSPTGVVTTT